MSRTKIEEYRKSWLEKEGWSGMVFLTFFNG